MQRLEWVYRDLVKKLTEKWQQIENLRANTNARAVWENSAAFALWQKHLPADLDGWQVLLLLQMLLVTPVLCLHLTIVEFAQYNALNPYFAGQIYSLLMVLSTLGVCAFSIFGAVELLRNREWPVLQQAARVLWLTGPTATLVMQVVIPWFVFGSLAETQTVGNILLNFSFALGLAAVWTWYISESEQIRNSFHAPASQPYSWRATIDPDSPPIVAGSKVPLYILIIFAIPLFIFLRNHSRAPVMVTSELSKRATVMPRVNPKQQPETPVAEEAVTVPEMHMGDYFILESIDTVHPSNNHRTKRTVTAVNRNSFDISVVNIKHINGKSRILRFDKGWNLIATRNPDHSGNDYAPALKYYEFPLVPGKTWKQTSIETDIKTGATKEHTIEGMVGAWEEVIVPAGSFRALKVSLHTQLYDTKRNQTTMGTDVSWYAPEVKRSVKSETSLTDAAGNVERSSLRLIEYFVQ